MNKISFNLYLLRHGESEQNRDGKYQLPTTRLSDKGRKQAEVAARRLVGIGIDSIASSDFDRAKETAGIIAKELDLEVVHTELLAELRRPSEMRGQPVDDPKIIEIKDIIFKNWGDKEFRYSDEETFYELKERARKVSEWILSLGKKNILLVSHEQFLRVLIFYLCFGGDLDPTTAIKLYNSTRIYNGGLSHLTYDGSKWKLITWNDVSHLTEE